MKESSEKVEKNNNSKSEKTRLLETKLSKFVSLHLTKRKM